VADTPQLNSDLLVSGEWLAGKLDDPGIVVLQVGSDRAAYEQGHIPGARFLPVSEIVVERDGNANELPPVAHLDSVFEALGVSDDTHVIIYGPPLLAARTFFTLDYLGHGDRAALLNGGLEGWKEEGRPLSTEEPQVTRTTFTLHPQPERVVDAEWVERHLDDPRVALIDARPEDQFTGAVAGAGIPRPGHIPGAGNLYWEKLIVSTEHPVLEDPERLYALFHEAGVEPGDTVITYCRTGMQASFAYFVSRYLGYETGMYDGSFMDWSPREELPVER
jgi:thiosulfate/3-mercaptopyruvate sulfurtransferase